MSENSAKSPNMALIKVYLLVYGLLFAAYLGYKLTGAQDLATQDFLKQAFGADTTAQTSKEALSQNFKAEKGHILLWDEVQFSLGKREYKIPADSRLTKPEALALALAIQTKAYDKESFRINKYGLPAATWSYGMTIYNIGGMVLLIVVFLRQPLTEMLDTQTRETSEALKAAREAQAEAKALKKRYQEMLAAVEDEKKKLEETAKGELQEEYDHIVNAAKHDAEGLMESLKSSLETDIFSAKQRLRAEIAHDAIVLAREIIAKEAGDKDHEAAVETFMNDLKKVKLG